jgi:hypothetical protein
MEFLALLAVIVLICTLQNAPCAQYFLFHVDFSL